MGVFCLAKLSTYMSSIDPALIYLRVGMGSVPLLPLLIGTMAFQNPVEPGSMRTGAIVSALISAFVAWPFYIWLLTKIVKLEKGSVARLCWSVYLSLVFMFLQILSYAKVYQATGLEHKGTLTGGDYVYFATITWTTVGYGDISPTANARVFAAIEAVSGYLFMGIVISIVGSYLLTILNEDRD